MITTDRLSQNGGETRTGKPSPRGSVGRPRRLDSDDRAIHDALLAAAQECLTTEETSRVPVRRIAAKAGVNQAMVNYYFNSKDGLFIAIFESSFLPLVKKLRDLEKQCHGDVDGCEVLENLIIVIEDHFAENPSLFTLHDDLMRRDTELNKAYNDRISARGFGSISGILKLLMDKGQCRSDITPDHASYFICSVCAMPFLLTPIFHAAFNGMMDGEFAALRRKSIVQMFQYPDMPLAMP